MPYHPLTPSSPASHLAGLVRDYITNYRPAQQSELDHFRNGFPTLAKAIEKAGCALQSNNRKAKHHWRRTKKTLTTATNILLANSVRLSHCRSFDELYELVSQLLNDVPWVAELYYYDTALSIGANLGVMPDKIYLHAGTRAGAKALGLDYKRAWIERSSLPADIKAVLAPLSEEEIENFLCNFKGRFSTSGVSAQTRQGGCLPPARSIPTPCMG